MHLDAKKMLKYSVVIPIYNESKILKNTIRTLNEYLKEKKEQYELIVADDGSIDGSSEIADQLKKEYPQVTILRNEKNQGRGSALTKAFTIANGEIIAYIDSDLSIDYHLFENLTIMLTEGYEVAICSKHLPESIVEYPKLRRLTSKCYSYLARMLFNANIKDYQCGFKAFKKDAIKSLLPQIESKRWFWDTEVLIKAHLKGYKIKEIPAKVVNIYERESTVHLIKDSYEMGSSLIKLFVKCRLK